MTCRNRNYYSMKRSSLSLLIAIPIFMCFSCKTTDWANKARFKEANQKLAQPESNTKRVVFMGNSITEGWSNHHPEFFAGKPFVNRGISGQTTDQMLERFKQDVVKLKPAVVVILAGTNDIAQNRGPVSLEAITGNISKMIDMAQKNHIKVILSSVLPAFDYPWRRGLHPNEKIPKLNAMIRALAKEKNVYYLDYFSAMAKEDNGMIEAYTYDGVHPDITGYKVMEPMVEKAIDEVLN